MKNPSRLSKSILAGAIIASASLGSVPSADAMMLAPLSQADDSISRSVVHLSKGVCTGTLIAPQWVLTANHCTKPLPGHPDMKVVEVGDDVKIGPDVATQETRTITELHNHPTYDATLVKLDAPAKTIPAEVFSLKTEVPIGAKTISYGWGDLTGQFDKKVGYQTGYIVEPVYSSAVGYDDMKDGVNNKLDGETKMVVGDSGGPLFLSDGRLYGVLSGGDLTADPLGVSTTTVYSQMPRIVDWLSQTTGIDFTSEENNENIKKQLSENPPKFSAPTDDMKSKTDAQEKEDFTKYVEDLKNKKKNQSDTETQDSDVSPSDVRDIPEAKKIENETKSEDSTQEKTNNIETDADTSVSSEESASTETTRTETTRTHSASGDTLEENEPHAIDEDSETRNTIEESAFLENAQDDKETSVSSHDGFQNDNHKEVLENSASLETKEQANRYANNVIHDIHQESLKDGQVKLDTTSTALSTQQEKYQQNALNIHNENHSQVSVQDSTPIYGTQGYVAGNVAKKKVGPAVQTGGQVHRNAIISFLSSLFG